MAQGERPHVPAAQSGGGIRRDVVFASIPLVVAIVVGALLLPRAVVPGDVPRPFVDERAFEATVRRDDALAEEARREALPVDVRALGSALRDFNRMQARDEADSVVLNEAKTRVDGATMTALGRSGGAALARLRAVQLRVFLAEVDRFAASGAGSPELDDVAGTFVRRLRRVGWCRGNEILLTRPELRVAFKAMWNGSIGLGGIQELEPTLDEQRVLYGLYLRLPHPAETSLGMIELGRKNAATPEACRAVEAGTRGATEAWRLEKIRRLAAIDPAYPGEYAAGIAQLRRGNTAGAIDAFRGWLGAHPDGPYAVRARNYLRAAVDGAVAAP